MPNDESVGRRAGHEPGPSWRPNESWDEYSTRWCRWAQQQQRRVMNSIIYEQPIVYGEDSTRGYWRTYWYDSATFTPEKRIHLVSPIFCQEVSP